MFAYRSDDVQAAPAGGRAEAPNGVRMSALRRLLGPDEAVFLETRPHPAALLPALARAGAAVVVCLLLALLLERWDVPLRRAWEAAAALVALLAVMRAGRVVWRWENTILLVTSEQVLVLNRGGRRSLLCLPLAGVDRLSVDQTIAGRLLGYGTVILAGRSRRDLDFVPRPLEVGGLILRLRP